MDKIKRKFNIIDVLIIFSAAALIVGFLFRDSIIARLNEKDFVAVNYTIKINSVENTRLEYLKTAVELFDEETGVKLGTVVSVKTENAKTEELLPDGKYYSLERTDISDAVITVTAEGFINETGIFLGGTALAAIGMEYRAATEFAVFEIVIISIE